MKLVVPIAAGLAAVSLGVPSAASAKVTKLKISLVTVKQQLIDVPPTQAANQPPDDGDYIVFTDRVVSKGKTIGTNKGICFADGFPEFLCTTTARLTGGTIAFHGIFNATSRRRQSIAVVGGTGRYRGARGQFTGRNVTDTRFDGTITLLG
jgi:hypothetical protein